MKKILIYIISCLLMIGTVGCHVQWSENMTPQSSVSNSSFNSDLLTEETDDVNSEPVENQAPVQIMLSFTPVDPSVLPDYCGSPYCIVNDNQPVFLETTDKSFEFYSNLDNLGRCGTAVSCIGQDLMPTEKRGSISMIKPSGWHTVKYDNIDGKYLYNRCHLIGFQLTAENANEKNLITGTRYLNVKGMLPFENMVADYIKETNNHVLYRVTPVFEGNNLVASGVQMEAYSVEDNGDGICYNIYSMNEQIDNGS